MAKPWPRPALGYSGAGPVSNKRRNRSLSRKRPVPVLRESRMIGHITVETEPAEPAIAEFKMDLFAQPPLRADAETVADDSLRIRAPDRSKPTFLAIERSQFLPQAVEFDEPVDRSQQMRFGHMPFKRKLVEQSFLSDLTSPSSTSPRPPTTRVNQRPRTCAIPSFQQNRPLAVIPAARRIGGVEWIAEIRARGSSPAPRPHTSDPNSVCRRLQIPGVADHVDKGARNRLPAVVAAIPPGAPARAPIPKPAPRTQGASPSQLGQAIACSRLPAIRPT